MKVRTLLAAFAALGLLALTAVGLGAWTGSASGAGGGDPPPTVAVAELSANGVVVAFFKDVHIASGYAASELELGPKGTTLPVKRRPPSILLSHGMTTDMELSAWHEAALAGEASGKRNAVLTLYASDFTPVARWTLSNAWPSRYDLDGDLGGDPPIESITLVGDLLHRVSP